MPPPRKKPRFSHPVKYPRTAPTEEIQFDLASRQEYLTGFHKRKLQRAKHAREIAEKKEREQKLRVRREVREGRKRELEERIGAVNLSIFGRRGGGEEAEEADARDGADGENEDGHDDDDEDEGGEETEEGQDVMVDHEEEYVDEDKFTTVVVEEVDVDRDGLHKHRPLNIDGSDEQDPHAHTRPDDKHAIDRDHQTETKNRSTLGKRKWTKEKPKDAAKPKMKKKKFRYESKAERRVTREKEKMKNRKQASARRKGE